MQQESKNPSHENEKNEDVSGSAGSSGDDGIIVDIDIKNLSNMKKLAKSKKPNLAKFKKLDVVKAKNFDFTKTNPSKTDFFISKIKEVFIHLEKAFTKATIFHYFESKCYIFIEPDASGIAIGRILSQINLDQDCN